MLGEQDELVVRTFVRTFARIFARIFAVQQHQREVGDLCALRIGQRQASAWLDASLHVDEQEGAEELVARAHVGDERRRAASFFWMHRDRAREDPSQIVTGREHADGLVARGSTCGRHAEIATEKWSVVKQRAVKLAATSGANDSEPCDGFSGKPAGPLPQGMLTSAGLLPLGWRFCRGFHLKRVLEGADEKSALWRHVNERLGAVGYFEQLTLAGNINLKI